MNPDFKINEMFDLSRKSCGGMAEKCLAQMGVDAARWSAEERACEEAIRRRNQLEREAKEATIELNEQTKVQNELLKEQLQEARAAVKSGRIWNWVMFIVAMVGVIVAMAK